MQYLPPCSICLIKGQIHGVGNKLAAFHSPSKIFLHAIRDTTEDLASEVLKILAQAGHRQGNDGTVQHMQECPVVMLQFKTVGADKEHFF